MFTILNTKDLHNYELAKKTPRCDFCGDNMLAMIFITCDFCGTQRCSASNQCALKHDIYCGKEWQRKAERENQTKIKK